MTIRFHDVSHYQGNYKPNGPTFAKATEGTSFVDSEYTQIKARTLAGKWPFAGYHFLHHGSAAAQASWAHRHIGSTPAMLDVEKPGSGANPTLADVTAFIDAYRKLGGVIYLVYLPHWYWNEIGSPSLKPLINRGIALISSEYTKYSDSGPGWASYGGMTPSIWQYTSTPIDTNAFKGTVAQLAALIKEGPHMPLSAADLVAVRKEVAAALADPATVKAFAKVLMATDVVPAAQPPFENADWYGTPAAGGTPAVPANTTWSFGYWFRQVSEFVRGRPYVPPTDRPTNGA